MNWSRRQTCARTESAFTRVWTLHAGVRAPQAGEPLAEWQEL